MITLNTLNSLIDDIMNIIRNSNISESENINRLQIKQWIDNYRVVLIKQDIDKDGDINPDYIQELGPLELDVVPFQKDSLNRNNEICKMISQKKLPRTMDLNKRYGIISITDLYGNIIQLGDKNKAVNQKNRRFTCNDYIAFMNNGNLNIMGPNIIEEVMVSGVFEDPEEVDKFNDTCSDPDKKYPLSYDKIPVLRELILSKELGIMVRMPSDTTNNSKNELLNVGQTRKQD